MKYSNDYESVKLPTRFVIACNDVPGFIDPSGALASRMLILDYRKSFVGKEDRELEGRLMAELSGIANWALAGLIRLRQQKAFSTCQANEKLVKAFHRQTSPILGFVQDYLTIAPALNPGNIRDVEMSIADPAVKTCKDLITRACAVWHERNEHDFSPLYLSRNLKSIMPALEYERRYYYGIALNKNGKQAIAEDERENRLRFKQLSHS